eukprot:g21625.t1
MFSFERPLSRVVRRSILQDTYDGSSADEDSDYAHTTVAPHRRSVLHPNNDLLCAILLICSPLVMFFGERLFKVVVALCGALGAAHLMNMILKGGESPETIPPAFGVVLLLVTGAFGAFISWKFVQVGFFILGAIVGALICNVIYQAAVGGRAEPSEEVHYGVLLLVAILGGVAGFVYAGHLVKVLTSFCGAYMFVGSIDHFGAHFEVWQTTTLDPTDGFFAHRMSQTFCEDAVCWLLVVSWLLLFAFAVMVQFMQLQCCCKDQKRYGQDYHYLDPPHYSAKPAKHLQGGIFS